MRWFPSGSALASQAPGHAQHSPRSDSAGHNLPPHLRPAVRLRTLPVDEALALLAGSGAPGSGLSWHEDYPMAQTLEALAMLLEAHRAGAPIAAGVPHWWLHQIVLDGVVVGDVGFHGPPAGTGPVEVEIGYNVVEGLRGRGIATRACRLLVDQAWRDGATAVHAETSPGNVASQRVLLRAGFRHEGGLRFVRARPEAVR